MKALIKDNVVYVIDNDGFKRALEPKRELGVYLDAYYKLWSAHMDLYVDNKVDSSEIIEDKEYEITDKLITFVDRK
jgi:hypothetical protein